MTAGELAKATAWHGDRPTLGQSCWGCCNSPIAAQAKVRLQKGLQAPLNRVTLWRCRSSNSMVSMVLDHTTQKVTIPTFSTVNVWANSSVKGHCMWVHVLTEPALGPQLPAAVVPTATYGELHPGSSRVPVCLHNLSACAMEVPAKTIIGQIVPAKQVPLVVHPDQDSCRNKIPSTKGMGFGGLRPPRPYQSGLSQSRNRPGSCCSNGNTCLHTVT